MGTGVSRRIAALIATIGILASGLCFFCSRAAQVAAARRTLASTFSNFSNDSGKSVEAVPAISATRRPQSVQSPKVWPGSAASTHWSTTPASSSRTTYAEARGSRLRGNVGNQSAGLFHITSEPLRKWSSRALATSSTSPPACRPTDPDLARRARRRHEGRFERRVAIAGHRICDTRNSGQRRCAGCHQNRTRPRSTPRSRSSIRWGASAKSAISPKPFSTSNPQTS